MKLISLALLLVLAVAVSAQIGPEKSHSFQDGSCNRNNNNCDWIVGHWKGFVTSRSTSLRFFDVPDRSIPLVNYPFATNFDDLWCTSRPYEIPYECTFGYSEEDDNLYQYCWFSGVEVSLCNAETLDYEYSYVREDNGEVDYFTASSFSTPAFFMTNRIVSLDSGISFENLETTTFTGCLPYDVASKDLIIGNLWDGFSPIGSCSSTEDDFGPSPVLPASCTEYFTTTTTTTVPTTTTTTIPTTTTTTTSTSTTSTTTTTTTSTSTTSTTTTSTSTPSTTTTTTTPTTTTSHTTTHPTNPDGEYGCSYIYEGIDAVYGFELARVRPASFPFDSISDSNRLCDGSKSHNCDCVRSSSDCNWLVGQWEGYLFAKGFNEYIAGDTYVDPIYPFPLTNDNVRCQWSETATPFQCSYYFNEETGYLNSHCWYDAVSGYANVGYDQFTTYAWEQWSEITSLNGGLNVGTSSASFLSADECIPLDRLDRDTFIQQFPDGFSSDPGCSHSPNTVFDCVDGFEFTTGNNNMFTLNYRIMDASWNDWDASSSFSPLIALSLLLAALLAFF